jgi:hypothetical protein
MMGFSLSLPLKKKIHVGIFLFFALRGSERFTTFHHLHVCGLLCRLT